MEVNVCRCFRKAAEKIISCGFWMGWICGKRPPEVVFYREQIGSRRVER
jgi:hypothetical protein